VLKKAIYYLLPQKSVLDLWRRLGKVKLISHGAVQKVIYVMSSEARHLSVNYEKTSRFARGDSLLLGQPHYGLFFFNTLITAKFPKFNIKKLFEVIQRQFSKNHK